VDIWNGYNNPVSLKKGNLVILTEGPSSRHSEANNRIEIIELRGETKEDAK
jgi:hypothetical protein